MHTINSVKYYYKITSLKDPWSPTLSWSTTFLPPSLLTFPLFPLHRAQKSTVHGFQPRNPCSGRSTASPPPNAWLLTLPSLQTRRYVQDIIFLYKIVSRFVDCSDLFDKIVFHVIKSLVFYCCSVQMIANCDFLLWLKPELSLCQQIADLKNTNTALKNNETTQSCVFY